MSYPALPDHRIPYHRDGTRIGYRISNLQNFNEGIASWMTQTEAIQFNDATYQSVYSGADCMKMWFFFPEQREVTAAYTASTGKGSGSSSERIDLVLHGSNDTTNGLDGTWEVASFPGGNPHRRSGAESWFNNLPFDDWRTQIKPVSFTGAKKAVRLLYGGTAPFNTECFGFVHLYGEKAAGQTPDDVIFIDDNTDLEFQAALDFGDRPLGTTVARVFRLKNTSSTKTANTVNLQCNDSDFSISADGVTWVATLNFSSLAPGAETSNLYVRCTTPGPGGMLGPRFAEMVVTVGSWT